MKQETRKKYLLKNTVIFSIGNFGSKLITFFLVPLYTNVLTTAEYGTVDLMTVLTTVVVPIITLNISEAVMRFSMDKDVKKEKILSIGLLISIVASIISMLSIPVFNAFAVTSNYSVLLSLYVLSFSVSLILLCYIRGIEKLLDYSIISIVQTAIIAILNIIFLVKFKLGIKGYILAYTISYFVTILLCLIRGNIKQNLKAFKVEKSLLKKMLKYSILLIPNSLMWWVMNSLDRIMVTSMIGVAENGIYAVSYKIPSILTTLTNIFNQAWMFSAVKEKESKDKNQYTTSIFNGLSTSVITITMLLLLILKSLLKVYVGADFYTSWKYVPPLIVGSAVLTLGTFLSNEYTAHKDSKGFLYSSLLGAIVNVTLNYIFIPKIGVLGASLATCISYVIVFIFRVFNTKKYVEIAYNNPKLIIDWCLLLASAFIVYLPGHWSFLNIITIMIFIFNEKKLVLKMAENIVIVAKKNVNKLKS